MNFHARAQRQQINVLIIIDAIKKKLYVTARLLRSSECIVKGKSRSAVRIHNDQNKSANKSGAELTYLTESELRGDTFAHKREPLVPDP